MGLTTLEEDLLVTAGRSIRWYAVHACDASREADWPRMKEELEGLKTQVEQALHTLASHEG